MRYFWPTVVLLLATGLQGNLPGCISLWGGKPDLVLVVLISYSLAADPVFGTTLGFIAGLLVGSSVGLSLSSFIVTRTITGFLAGLVTTRLFSENPLVPALSAIWLTVVCEVFFLLGNPPPVLSVGIWKVAGECISNAVFTLFVYYALRHLNTSRKIRMANARL